MIPSLTPYEMQLATDPDIIKAKNAIIKKVHELFENLAEEYKKELSNKISGGTLYINPKISRGENYQGLPYVILDFPRQFGKEDIFAIRSFFWWGNFFSITLHLAGKYQKLYTLAIQNAIDDKHLSGWYLGTSKNQWEHHFDNNNYIPLTEEVKNNIAEFSFLKLAKKIPLTKWDETGSFFTEDFKLLIEIIEVMPRSYEINLSPGTPTTDFDL